MDMLRLAKKILKPNGKYCGNKMQRQSAGKTKTKAKNKNDYPSRGGW